MRRGYIYVVVVLGVLLTLGYFGTKFMLSSKIIVRISNDVSILDTTVTIDGKHAAPFGSDGRQFAISVRTGEHLIKVSSSGYSEYETRLSTSVRSTKQLDVTLDEIPAETVAERLYPDDTIVNPMYFGNRSWVAFHIAGAEGSLAVARFDESSGTWEVVEEGTDINPAERTFSNAPADLINYLRQP